MQHVLERGKAQERSQIIGKLTGKIVRLSQHKYASNVVEKCLEHGDAAERELLIEEIIGRTEENDNLLVFLDFSVLHITGNAPRNISHGSVHLCCLGDDEGPVCKLCGSEDSRSEW